MDSEYKSGDYELIRRAVSSVLDERRSVDAESHHRDHEFVHELRLRAKRRDDLIENTKKQVFGWATIGILGFVGYSILIHLKTVIVRFLNIG